MKTGQFNTKKSSEVGVNRIPETHKKTTSTGTTFRDKRR